MTSQQSNDAEDPVQLKEDEKPSKLIRTLTVTAYVFSVSFAALMLSLYYIFVWTPEHPTHTGRLEGDEDYGASEELASKHH